MMTWTSSTHASFIVVAYGLMAVCLIGLLLHSVASLRKARRLKKGSDEP